jgi:hypothetical protein
MRDQAAQCRAARFDPNLKQKSEFKWFKTFSNLFKLRSIRKVLSLAQKIEIKYSFEALKEGNNFLYRNFLGFRIFD